MTAPAAAEAPRDRAAVVLVTPEFAPSLGGVQTHVAALADGLAARGRNVLLLTQASSAVVHARGRHERITGASGASYVVRRYPHPVAAVPEVPSPALLRAARRAASAGAVVHAHNYHALLFALTALAVAARCSGRRRRATAGGLVLTPHYHGVGSTRLRSLAHRVYAPVGRAAVRRADALVAVAEPEHRLLRRHFPDVPPLVTVVPNGARVPRPGTAAMPLDRPTVFTCGRLTRHKRVDVLVLAVARLPGADLVVAGTGPEQDRLRELAERNGVADRVHFLGRVEDGDLARWFASDVLFATASTVEAFGLSLADALAAGRSAVVSPLPAHRALAAAVGSVPGPAVRFLPPLDTHSDLPDEYVAAAAAQLRAALSDLATGAPQDRPQPPAHGAAAPGGPLVSPLASWADMAAEVDHVYDRVTSAVAAR